MSQPNNPINWEIPLVTKRGQKVLGVHKIPFDFSYSEYARLVKVEGLGVQPYNEVGEHIDNSDLDLMPEPVEIECIAGYLYDGSSWVTFVAKADNGYLLQRYGEVQVVKRFTLKLSACTESPANENIG